MILSPLKMKKEDSAISPVFGKVKYLGIAMDNGVIDVIDMVGNGGMAIVTFMIKNNIKTTILHHAGPVRYMLEMGLEIYYAGDERITFPEAIAAMKEGKLTRITFENMDLLAKHDHDHGEAGHSHDEHHSCGCSH